MNQIINMIIRQVMNQLVRRGISAGINQASKIGKNRSGRDMADAGTDQPQMSKQDRQAGRASQQNAKRASQSMKAVRRVTKL